MYISKLYFLGGNVGFHTPSAKEACLRLQETALERVSLKGDRYVLDKEGTDGSGPLRRSAGAVSGDGIPAFP